MSAYHRFEPNPDLPARTSLDEGSPARGGAAASGTYAAASSGTYAAVRPRPDASPEPSPEPAESRAASRRKKLERLASLRATDRFRVDAVRTARGVIADGL